MFIIGHQWPSVAISGHQLAITCDGVPVELALGRNQNAPGRNQRQSVGNHL